MLHQNTHQNKVQIISKEISNTHFQDHSYDSRQVIVISFFLIITLLGACSEKLNLVILDGTYKGFFYFIPPGGGQPTKSAEEISLSLSGNTYTSSAGTGRIPAGGSGKFMAQQNNKLQFTDEQVWTADFDWNMILNGNYRYELKSDSLILTRNFEICSGCNTLNGTYQYRLKRIN